MQKDYISVKEENKKWTKTGILLMWLFIIIFISVIFRFALNAADRTDMPESAPTSGDIFNIAKKYVQPTLLSADYQFADNDYQCFKNSDSIYVVKSYCSLQSAKKSKVNFSITLKYDGGDRFDKNSWSVLSLIEK